MSAYLCDPHHAAYLAAYAVVEKIVPYRGLHAHGYDDEIVKGLRERNLKTIPDLAVALARANVASLEERYGNIDKVFEEGYGLANYLADVREAADPKSVWDFTPVQVIKAANCFDYQTCEIDAYEDLWVSKLLNSIVNNAIHDLPGYDKAKWGAPEAIKGQVLLSAL